MSDDLISRAAAIETVRKAQSIGQAHRMLLQLPPAQPSVSKTEIVEDCISRQAMINEINLHVGILYDSPTLVESLKLLVWSLPSAQPTGTNTVQVEDCISRAAIVDAIEGVDWYHMTDSGEMVHGANSAEDQPWYKAEDIYAAIEALPSAQPECEDAVSRFEVLRLIDYSSNDLNDSVDNWYFQGKVKELPSVTPKQPGWIPCSERCPAHRVYVLVTYKPVYGIPDIGITWYSKSEGKWNTSRKVLAWMPLPKPWEGEKP